jgi:NADP-dependent 3-hydroxy acid dehydrogenase YdfG
MSKSCSSILVSPASSGIGLAVAQALLRSTHNTNTSIIATARSKNLDQVKQSILSAPSLKGLSIDPNRIKMLHVDYLDEGSIEKASAEMSTLLSSQASQLRLAVILPGE